MFFPNPPIRMVGVFMNRLLLLASLLTSSFAIASTVGVSTPKSKRNIAPSEQRQYSDNPKKNSLSNYDIHAPTYSDGGKKSSGSSSSGSSSSSSSSGSSAAGSNSNSNSNSNSAATSAPAASSSSGSSSNKNNNSSSSSAASQSSQQQAQECTGSYPSGPGVEVQGFSWAVAGPSSVNTVYQYFTGSQNGCYWKCKSGYAVNSSKSNCVPREAGSGLTVRVLDTANNPISGATVEVIGSLCLSTAVLHSSSTDSNGNSTEAFVEKFTCGNIIHIAKAGYEIKNADGCSARVTRGYSYCDSASMTNSQVTVYMSNGSTPAAGPGNSSNNSANKCSTGEFKNGSNETVEYQCNCSSSKSGWVDVGGGCFHRIKSAAPAQAPEPTPAPAPAASCTSGEFNNESGRAVMWRCGCSSGNDGWVDVGGGCFHKLK